MLKKLLKSLFIIMILFQTTGSMLHCSENSNEEQVEAQSKDIAAMILKRENIDLNKLIEESENKKDQAKNSYDLTLSEKLKIFWMLPFKTKVDILKEHVKDHSSAYLIATGGVGLTAAALGACLGLATFKVIEKTKNYNKK